MNRYVNEIKKKIQVEFPYVNTYIQEDDGEYFILIDSEKVYDSNEFQMFILDLNIHYILDNGLSGIFFSYESKTSDVSISSFTTYNKLYTNSRYIIADTDYSVKVNNALPLKEFSLAA